MNQLRKAKSRNRRRHAVLPRKYIKVVVNICTVICHCIQQYEPTHYSMYLQGRKKKNSEFMRMNSNGSRRSPGGRKHRRGIH